MIHKRIKKLREHFGYTQKEFAEALGLSRRNVQRWEYAESDISEHYLRLIQYTFNVNSQWLRNGIGDMLIPPIEEDTKMVLQWLQTLSAKDQIWAAKEIERKIPEFRDWLKNSK